MVSPKKAYDDQKRHAEDRGIEWSMPYEDWLEIWLLSGKWSERGRKSGQYCMCRIGDTGPYSKRNCFISTTDKNQQARWENVRKLQPKVYKDVYELYTSTDLSQYAVAEIFGVDQSYVSKIVSKIKKELV